MNLSLMQTKVQPPTPAERKRNINLLRWWWFEQNGYDPHTAQMDFHLSPARFRMCIAGTRGGKSRSAAEEAVLYLWAGATRIWIVGQTYALTEKEFRYIHERMVSQQARALLNGLSPVEHITNNPKGGDMRIKTRWGSEVICVSLDKADLGALGEEVDLILISEAAVLKKPKYKWDRYLRGRLTTRLGDLIIPTTPAGKTSEHDPDGWLFSMYERGLDPEQEDYFTREWPSWENPAFPEDPYELRRELDPKIFAEQYEGKFVIFAGALYDAFDERIHVIEPFKIPPHWRRYEGIDPGFSGQFVWLGSVVSEAGNVYITDEYSDTDRLYGERVEAIKRQRSRIYGVHESLWELFSNKHNIRSICYIDPEDPQCGAEFNALGMPNIKANNDVMVGIDRVARRLKWTNRYPPSLYITSNCVDLIEALKNHRWGEKKSEKARRPAQDKYKHWCDALRYICAGNIVAAEPLPEILPDEPTMYEIMMDHIGAQSAFPLDESYDRRAAYINAA